MEGAYDLIRFRVGGSGGSEDGRGRLLDAGGGGPGQDVSEREGGRVEVGGVLLLLGCVW